MRRSAQREEIARPGSSKPESDGPRPGPRRRRVWVFVLLSMVVLGLIALVLVHQLGSVRHNLVEARIAMERGRNELVDGDAAAAVASFERGRLLFQRGADGAGGPLLDAVSWLPVAGRTTDAISAIAGAGVSTADAARVLAAALADTPGGLAGLAPTNGRLSLERFPSLAKAAGEADTLMVDAVSRLDEAPRTLLLGPVASARRDAAAELAELRDKVHAASLLLQSLPRFLGADGPRRYFVGPQNPAELRGTGGLIGAYSILTIDEGHFRFEPFEPIQSLPTPVGEVPAPNDDYATNYESFRGGDRFWTAINVMPDFPSVAQAILSSYEASTHERLDGVILADPFALSSLLRATGPVELPGYGIRIDAHDVVPFTTNEAYSVLTDPEARKRVLGDVARAAFGQFIAQPSPSLADLELLLQASSDRHILVYSSDPTMQEGLAATPVAGTLTPAGADGDLLSVIVNSAAGSKVDFYQERDIIQTVSLHEDGSAAATVDLDLRNHAPTSGQPTYILGPFHPKKEDGQVGPVLDSLNAGESVALINLYCGTDCVPVDAQMDGAPIPARSRVDLGVRYFQEYLPIRAGEARSLRFAWTEPNAWEGNSSGGVYHLTFANQITVRPTHVRITIQPPEGMNIVSASGPLQIIDGAAVYEGTPGARLDLEVAFAPPTAVRLWRNVTRSLTSTIFEI